MQPRPDRLAWHMPHPSCYDGRSHSALRWRPTVTVGRRASLLRACGLARRDSAPTACEFVLSISAILTLGFLLGMRHATDADHVVAVSTIVCRQRTLRAAVPIGILWGIGHTVTILVIGGTIIFFGMVIPPRLGLMMELSVGVMLLLLGIMNVGWSLRCARRAPGSDEAGPHPPEDRPPSSHTTSLRPLLVGVVHGLAGSAAVTLLVLGSIRAPLQAVAYLVVFGAGTIAGMLLITTALATPMVLVSGHFAHLRRTLGIVTGLASVVLGTALVYEIGFTDGLFTRQPHGVPE